MVSGDEVLPEVGRIVEYLVSTKTCQIWHNEDGEPVRDKDARDARDAEEATREAIRKALREHRQLPVNADTEKMLRWIGCVGNTYEYAG
jgi:hypothetical protein